jgi:predicted MFS family arabinose efflux permease
VGVACGAILSSRIAAHIDQRQLLIVCYVMQALGVVLSNWMPNLLGFAIGSILVGLPFTAITFFVMQLGRKLHPQSAASMIGLLTASFGACQIAGPPIAAYLLSQTLDQQQGFSWALDLAAISLLAGALIYVGMIKTHPHHTKQLS